MLTLLYDIVSKITLLVMLTGTAAGLVMAFLVRFRAASGSLTSNRIWAAWLIVLSLTLLQHTFEWNWRQTAALRFLPIYYSFAFAPLAFFFAKSRLYPNFKLLFNDLKHFILPIAQFLLLFWLWLQPTADRQWLASGNLFTPFYGNFERGVYILQLGLYLYFAYRFIRHQRARLTPQSPRRQRLLAGWLKRMYKVYFLLFAVEAVLILCDYFSLRLFNVNLKTGLLFVMGLELSLATQLWWLILNAFFAWRRKI
jgi:hypothetical protein